MRLIIGSVIPLGLAAAAAKIATSAVKSFAFKAGVIIVGGVDIGLLTWLQYETPGDRFELVAGGDYVSCNGLAAVKMISLRQNDCVSLSLSQMFVPDEQFLKNFAAVMGEDYFVRNVYQVQKGKDVTLGFADLAFLPNGWSVQLVEVIDNTWPLDNEANFLIRDNNGLIVDCNIGFGMAMDVDDKESEGCPSSDSRIKIKLNWLDFKKNSANILIEEAK